MGLKQKYTGLPSETIKIKISQELEYNFILSGRVKIYDTLVVIINKCTPEDGVSDHYKRFITPPWLVGEGMEIVGEEITSTLHWNTSLTTRLNDLAYNGILCVTRGSARKWSCHERKLTRLPGGKVWMRACTALLQ